MRQLWRHAGRVWRRWVLGGIFLVLTNIAAMTVPQLVRRAVDDLRGGAPTQDLQRLAMIMAAVAVLGAVFRTLSRLFILYAARDVELSLRTEFYRHLTAMDPDFFVRFQSGDLMSRATNDLTQVRLMLGPGALNIVNTIIAYATAVPLMLMMSVRLTLITFAVYPPAVVLMRHLGRRLYLANRRQQEALGALSTGVQENLAGAQLVRAYVAEDVEIRRFGDKLRRVFDANVGLVWIRSGMFRLAVSISSVAMLMTVFFGAYEVIGGRLSVGEVVALIEYMALLSGPTFAMGWVLSLWQRGAASMARLEEVLSVAPGVVGGTLAPTTLTPNLKASHLSVLRGGRRVLRDVSFAVEAGQTLGIVGPIGSGKTTLLRACLRLLPIEEGSLRLGDVNIGELTLGRLRQALSYVPQNPTLLSRTLGENVAFGRPDAARSAIEEALHTANLVEDISALPHGLETQVGERGVGLSGGQKQRGAIARALLLDAEILLLDDVLSAVDTETEATILASLRASRRGKTTLIVAHRLTAVRQADLILVLDKGEVAETGTHEALMAQNGMYAQMAKQQATAQATKPPAEAMPTPEEQLL